VSNNGPSQDAVDFTHITQEMYKQNLELAEKNATLRLLQRIDEAVLGSAESKQPVPQLISDLVVHESSFNLAIVYTLDDDPRQLKVSGLSYQRQMSMETEKFVRDRIGTLPFTTGNTAAIVSSQEIHIADGFSSFVDGMDQSTDQSLKQNLAAVTLFICPMKTGMRFLGLLVLGVDMRKEQIPANVHNLVGQLDASVGVAIENHLLYKDLQEATDKLKGQNERLQDLDQIKNEFISMATHQLGTPLAVIDGYISMILSVQPPLLAQKYSQYLNITLQRTRLMKRLVADFLDFNRIEAGRFSIQAKPMDLNQAVPQEVDMLTQKAKSKGVELNYISPVSPVPNVIADEQKTRMAIMNLIDNAIAYSPRGHVNVKLTNAPEKVIFTVSDDGIGVPESQKATLFSKFTRAENAKRERPDGTGIGLFLVKKVVEAQGGQIIFESQENHGSTFGFSLPTTKPATV